MAGKNSGSKDGRRTVETKRKNDHALIASKLRSYYDSIIDEGTPPHFLDLLERLDEAERNSKD
ncbi:NepR family anti-sigma factor [Rhizobium daejeonense]